MADLARIWKSLRGQRQRESRDDFQATKLYARPGDEPWPLTPNDRLEVSETPLDTLPAELREELTRPTK